MITYAWKKVLTLRDARTRLILRGLVQLLSTDYKFAVSFVILLIVLAVPANGYFPGESRYERRPEKPITLFALVGRADRVRLDSCRGGTRLCSCSTWGLLSAIMALGVNLQWGFAGLFNVGDHGFCRAWGAGGRVGVDAILRAKLGRSGGAQRDWRLCCLGAGVHCGSSS